MSNLEAAQKPLIRQKDITGAGTHGYLSVRRGSPSEAVVKQLLKTGVATMDKDGCESFQDSLCVDFESHFRNHVRTE